MRCVERLLFLEKTFVTKTNNQLCWRWPTVKTIEPLHTLMFCKRSSRAASKFPFHNLSIAHLKYVRAKQANNWNCDHVHSEREYFCLHYLDIILTNNFFLLRFPLKPFNTSCNDVPALTQERLNGIERLGRLFRYTPILRPVESFHCCWNKFTLAFLIVFRLAAMDVLTTTCSIAASKRAK